MGSGGGAALGNFARAATAISTFGLSEAPGKVGQIAKDAAVLNPMGYPVAATARTAQGIVTAPENARKAADDAAAKQNKAEADLLEQMKLQPQAVAPDNFAATKRRQLDSLRMGIASTMKYSGGAAPSVSTPTLKTKLGQ